MLILPEGKRICVRLWCYDPSEHLRRVFRRVGGTALFSATLAPMDHYARQLGLDTGEADTLLRLESPFPPENLLAARLPVSVKYTDRERTLDAVVRIIHTMAEAHPGNYLACFPSFAYLNQAYERYRFYYPDDRAMRQLNAMDENARAQFIDCFEAHPTQSMVAFIVLGGVFAEGVDLPDDRLSGAAIVSTGMPQIGFERVSSAMTALDRATTLPTLIRACVACCRRRAVSSARRPTVAWCCCWICAMERKRSAICCLSIGASRRSASWMR